MYILEVYLAHFALRWNTNVKKNFLRTNETVQKMRSFFFRELQRIIVLLLICDSYISWSTKFVSLKMFVGFYIFDYISFLLKFIFLFNKLHGLFGFETS